jgi:predicted metal-dependent peptidase
MMKVIVNVCSIIGVLAAFLENPENKKTVNHIDHNTINNVYNLEWATRKNKVFIS